MIECGTITVDQLAAYLGISRRMAYALTRLPGFPAFNVGKRVLVSKDGLKEWIKKGGTKQYDTGATDH